jgi:putative acetyltransferase
VSPPTIRRFVPTDAHRVCLIFYRSVHEVARSHYDEAQRNAWAPKVPDAARWLTFLREFETFVAVDESDEAVAWIAMTDAGYIDMLFCAPEAVGHGVATRLYQAVEAIAIERGRHRMTAHASLLAQPFFVKHGWTIDAHELHERNGVRLPRAAMSKRLT